MIKSHFLRVFASLLFVFAQAGFAADTPWAAPECHMSRKNLKLGPEALVKEFLKRDAQGDFLKTDHWFNSATVCPEHESGPDEFNVIKNYKVEKAASAEKTSRFKVTYQVLGLSTQANENGVECFGFVPGPRTFEKVIKVYQTPHGWKLQDGMLNDKQFVSQKTALNFSASGKSLCSKTKALLGETAQ